MSKEFLDNLDQVLANPSLIQSLALGYVQKVHNGEVDFSDPSNPFVELMEASGHMTAAAVSRFEVGGRKLHPIVAVEPDDIYHHMTDKDYLDRFAQPVQAPFYFVFREDELKNRLVLDESLGYRKLILPENSMLSVAGYTFSLPYAVEIREQSHGVISCVYLANTPSPLMSIADNQVPIYYSSDNADNRYLTIKVECLQYDIVSVMETLSPSLSKPITKTITKEYFYARVFVDTGDNSWRELQTTHSDQTYDPNSPTAVLKVVGKQVSASIPQIYLSQGLVGKMRLDIYQTEGPLHVDFGGFSEDEYKFTVKTSDPYQATKFVSPIAMLETLRMFSDRLVSGGRKALSMEALRERVIMNTTGPKVKPITPDQIRVALVDRGYDIVKTIDHLTSRVFVASRLLPTPTYDRLITAASLSMQSVVFSNQEAVSKGNVIDNGTSITITPEVIYQNVSGITRMLSATEVNDITNLPVDQRVFKVNSMDLYYSPFHYVVDTNELHEFDVRPYYLSAPKAVSKMFVQENASTDLSVNTQAYSLTKTESGYRLVVSTRSNKEFKARPDEEVHAQLAYRPEGGKTYYHLPGILLGRSEDDEFIFAFDLSSTHYVDRDHLLELSTFHTGDGLVRKTGVLLDQSFELLYGVTGTVPADWQPNLIDTVWGDYLNTSRVAGVNWERIRLEFGKALKNLWSQNRNLSSGRKYATYVSDIQATYKENAHEVVLVEGKAELRVIHRKGDPVFTDQNEPVIAHFKGETMRDALGLPIVLNERTLQNQLDILMVDATYVFSNDPVAKEYQKEVSTILTQWITEDIERITPDLLEKTRIYFYPKTTTGLVDVMYSQGLITSINASQSLHVELSVGKVVAASDELKQQLKLNTIRAINTYFDRQVISISELTKELRNVYGGDVIDVRVSNLGGEENNFPVVTLMSETDRLSIGKSLINRSDGVMVVEEDITIDFVRHGLDTMSQV